MDARVGSDHLIRRVLVSKIDSKLTVIEEYERRRLVQQQHYCTAVLYTSEYSTHDSRKGSLECASADKYL